jgi:uncharacterized phiE125 gp8 family phage protein
VSFRLLTAPVSEPVTLAEAKAHVRVTDANSDALITAQITAARQYVEEQLSRALIEQTWELYLDCFPDEEIVLPRPPLLSVTSIKYLDNDGALQTLPTTDYKVDAISEPAQVVVAYGKSWPGTRIERNAVIVTYVAGYGSAATAVPQAIRQAVLLTIGEMYERREESIVGAPVQTVAIPVRALLSPYRILQI